jgi:hypothetical protein
MKNTISRLGLFGFAALFAFGALLGHIVVRGYAALNPVPVVEKMRVTDWHRSNDGAVAASVVGIKARDCAFDPSAVVGIAASGGEYHVVPFYFTNSGGYSGGISRPVGYQDFGVWVWGKSSEADAVMLEVTHYCGDRSGPVSTTIGPFKVPK